MNILIKLIANGMIGIPGLWWSGTSLAFAVITSVLVSLLAYALGDALILPATNNTFATTFDFLFVFALFWAACALFQQPHQLSGILLTSFLVGVVEFFYHAYLLRKGVEHTRDPG